MTGNVVVVGEKHQEAAGSAHGCGIQSVERIDGLRKSNGSLDAIRGINPREEEGTDLTEQPASTDSAPSRRPRRTTI